MNGDCDFGLIGLAVMGENLALNVESRGYKVAVYNRTTEKVDELIKGRAAGKNFVGTHSIEEFVKAVKRPRKLMMLVKAGPAVDAIIESLIPLCDPGDITIEIDNSWRRAGRPTARATDDGATYERQTFNDSIHCSTFSHLNVWLPDEASYAYYDHRS